jgi:hypothetical protein
MILIAALVFSVLSVPLLFKDSDCPFGIFCVVCVPLLSTQKISKGQLESLNRRGTDNTEDTKGAIRILK